ncbi:MAG: histone-lysine N-methyltransferase [Lentisphaerae bacterium]|jgi:isopropylmalate/homocitrate/citramalate synthase|nr:histone-lysine N-methyltransferase [Lentisphaerota bacterium]
MLRFTPLVQKKLRYELVDVKQPNLLREQFPYSEVPRILFENRQVTPSPAKEIWITDTTFRDGQQSRPPYSPEHIEHLYDLMNKLGGPNGIIRQCEFFVYSKKDQEAIERCMALGHQYPEITGWIRANAEDFQLVKRLGLKETGILTSVSDYHIFLKLKKTRRKVMDDYLATIKEALSNGIIPRCHFEDITRADIYGFCLPFAEELMKLSQQSKIPIKIRLCDTMGYGLTYPSAVLPRSVPKLAEAFHKELGIPSQQLEWHGHNDFHKVHVNAVTAWLHGISALNASLIGYGERTGNPPLEGAIIEYIGLKGRNCGIDTRVITEIAEYYREVIKVDIPENYPFVGIECNTTRAGIHADGLLKNPEIYNIFDTQKILNRPIKVMVTDKSGLAGIAQWLNDYLKENPIDHEPISKRHPGVRHIHEWVTEQYAQGRTSSISSDEMIAQAKRHVPSMFESDFQKVKNAAVKIGKKFAASICKAPEILTLEPKTMEAFIKKAVRAVPSIQFVAITNRDGKQLIQIHTQRGDKGLFRPLFDLDFKEKEWFRNVIETGEAYWSDLFFSRFTGRLIMTFAEPIRDKDGNIVAVLDIDFKFDDLTKLVNQLPADQASV